MRVGSLFAGVGGFDLGLERAGAKVVWQVEIDAACRSVLRRHWPDVDLREDVRDVGAHNLAPVDVVVGGFPCQDLSVAGRRAGLAGARSGLWWEFHRLLAELRPTWVVVENVPGLLSSNGGRDMGTLLWSLGQLGYGYAYRVLDAQWAGVPQRRRRIFIVGHYRDWRAPAQVLLEPEGCLRDTPPRRKEGQTVGSLLASGAGTSRPAGIASETDFLVARALTAPQSQRYDGDTENFVVAATLNSGGNSGGFRTEPGEHLIPSDPTSKGMLVRRLTPREAERLQGFPDDWTLYGHDGKRMADSTRYRMMGNAVAVPVVEWIARRIMAYENAREVA